MVIGELLGRLHYVVIFALAATGLALALGASNLMRRIAGLALAWTGLILFFAAAGVLVGAGAPIVAPNEASFGKLYSNPLPQALMLGATMIGAATVILALAVVIRVRESYGAIEAADIAAADKAQDAAEASE
jgi:multicomponent Na+:H+ antiporter subunit C